MDMSKERLKKKEIESREKFNSERKAARLRRRERKNYQKAKIIKDRLKHIYRKATLRAINKWFLRLSCSRCANEYFPNVPIPEGLSSDEAEMIRRNPTDTEFSDNDEEDEVECEHFKKFIAVEESKSKLL